MIVTTSKQQTVHKSYPGNVPANVRQKHYPEGWSGECNNLSTSTACADYVRDWVGEVLEQSVTPLVVVLEGGHFDPISGSDAFAENSLICSLRIGRDLIQRYGRKVRVVYGVLIDDLGLDCDGSACNINTGRQDHSERWLPPELEAILAHDRFVKRERVILSTERHSRNHGLKQFKRLLRKGADQVENAWTVEERDGLQTYLLRADDGMTVEIARREDMRWTIKCPLIMASHYAHLVMQVEHRFQPGHGIAIVDFSELSDRGKVTRGSELALRAMIPAESTNGMRSILNVFWGDDVGDLFFTDSFHDLDWT